MKPANLWHGRAKFDNNLDKTHRYCLERIWDNNADSPYILFVMLNPSSAGNLEKGQTEGLDKTIPKCKKITYEQGYKRFIVVNLFSYIETKSKKLDKIDNSILVDPNKTDRCIEQLLKDPKCEKVVVAWGSSLAKLNWFQQRKAHVEEILQQGQKPLFCLKRNQNGVGEPSHPLCRELDLKKLQAYDLADS